MCETIRTINCIKKGYGNMKNILIDVASFRTHNDMEVVSGTIGHEKVHYLALPQKEIQQDIEKLLA